MRFLPILFLVSCSSPGFYYDRYGLDIKNEKLLHFKDLEKDKSLKECADGFKCVVFFSSEFYKMKSDYEKMQSQLEACQSD